MPSASLTAADVLRIRAPREARMSPDGTMVACSIAHTDDSGAHDRATIWLLDLDGAARPLTDGGGIDTEPRWTPGGDAVVFRSLRDGVTHARRVAIDSGELTEIATSEQGVGTVGPLLSPDGARVAYSAPVAPRRDPAAPYRVTTLFWRLDGAGLIDDLCGALFARPLAGGEAIRLTGAEELIVDAQWSPDGVSIGVLSIADMDDPRFVLRAVDAAGGGAVELWSGDYWVFPPAFSWLPDGRLVRSSANLTLGVGQPTNLVVAPGDAAADGRPLAQVQGWPFGVVQGDFPWVALQTPRLIPHRGGDEVYHAVQAHGRVEVWATPVEDGMPARPLVAEDALAVPLDATETHVLVAKSTPHVPADLWLVPIDGGEPRRLTRLNEDWLPATPKVEVTTLSVTGAHGDPVDAWLVAPKGADGPLPTLLTNHGGPHASWGYAFSFDALMLADAGYATLLVNQHGSTGAEPAFAQAILGRWGEDEREDLLAAVDAAVAADLADPEALGVWGISAGAYLTARLITTDDRFRAAVVESPCLDTSSMLACDHGFLMRAWWGAGPGQGREATALLATQAPTTDAGCCTTPTLIIQHELDARTPPMNSELFFVGLRLGGCEAEMLRMPKTAHAGSIEPGDPRARVAQNEALLEWFGRHLEAGVARVAE